MRTLESLAPLVGGICLPSAQVRTGTGEPPFAIQMVLRRRPGRGRDGLADEGRLAGSGTALSRAEATVPALAELIERHAATTHHGTELIHATARELGDDALDLDTLPKCSDAELADPQCPLVAPDKDQPIRWVRGIRLRDGQLTYVPAALVYQGLPAQTNGERIALGISTGCAAYVSYEGALLRGALEVIERDAISLVWLRRLPLPRLDVDVVSEALAPCWLRAQERFRDLSYALFDATTDLDVPTVYGLQIAQNDPRVTTLVSCASACTAEDAIGKVLRDMAHIRVAFQWERSIPADWRDFSHVLDGATLMAREDHARAFAFLLNSSRVSRASSLSQISGDHDGERLREVLNRLRHAGAEAFAVDLSTDEAIRCGLKVVKVVIPALQPLSFNYRARYLGHARLRDALRTLGYPPTADQDVNHYPQPFA